MPLGALCPDLEIDAGASQIELPVSNLPTGLYLFRLCVSSLICDSISFSHISM